MPSISIWRGGWGTGSPNCPQTAQLPPPTSMRFQNDLCASECKRDVSSLYKYACCFFMFCSSCHFVYSSGGMIIPHNKLSNRPYLKIYIMVYALTLAWVVISDLVNTTAIIERAKRVLSLVMPIEIFCICGIRTSGESIENGYCCQLNNI